MKYLKPTMIIFAILILIAFGLGIAQTVFGWEYSSEFSVVNYITCGLLGVFCITVVIGLFGQKFNVNKIGFYLLHIGFIVFLSGTLLFRITGVTSYVNVPTDSSVIFNELPVGENESIEVDFGYALDEFEISYYEPTYTVYVNNGNKIKILYENIEYDKENTLYDFKDYGTFSFDLYNNGVGGLPETIPLADGVLARLNLDVKQYTATMTFLIDGNYNDRELSVNHPIYVKGYKIYLMDYNTATEQATILFKKDIGEPLSVAGIILIIFGTFYHTLIYPILKENKLPLKKTSGGDTV